MSSETARDCGRLQQISNLMATFLNTEFKTKKQKKNFILYFMPFFGGNQPLFDIYFNSLEHGRHFVAEMKKHATFLENITEEGSQDLLDLTLEKLTAGQEEAEEEEEEQEQEQN